MTRRNPRVNAITNTVQAKTMRLVYQSRDQNEPHKSLMMLITNQASVTEMTTKAGNSCPSLSLQLGQ
jgi:hypothetical protein